VSGLGRDESVQRDLLEDKVYIIGQASKRWIDVTTYGGGYLCAATRYEWRAWVTGYVFVIARAAGARPARRVA
jgi:hypothetical protein